MPYFKAKMHHNRFLLGLLSAPDTACELTALPHSHGELDLRGPHSTTLDGDSHAACSSDALTTADDQQVTLIALLDLSSAFDWVDHELLLRRLQYNSASQTTCCAG